MKFGIIGVGGFIAPKHLEAIKQTGNEVVAALDINDSVGILDSYFPETHFFTEYERFERHLVTLADRGEGIDYLVVCSPNYLHDVHTRLGLNTGANVICEKPLTVNLWNLDLVRKAEERSGKKVYAILQMRLHPAVKKMREISKSYNLVEVEYISPRGKWYDVSWKADKNKSGGIIYNIGIHLFDLLCWIYGKCKEYEIYYKTEKEITGMLLFENAEVNWHLSIENKEKKRLFAVNNEEIDFTKGFENLHIESYRQILKGCGFGIDDAYPSIELAGKLQKECYERVYPYYVCS